MGRNARAVSLARMARVYPPFVYVSLMRGSFDVDHDGPESVSCREFESPLL